MLEGKKSNISLFLESAPVSDVAVGVSFEVKGNSCIIHKLESGIKCDCFPQGAEETVVAYSLYLAVKNALTGDAIKLSKFKVGTVSCCLNDSNFSISWQVQGTGSAVRKTLSNAIKVLSPAKTFPIYSDCMRRLGKKIDKENFNYAAEKLIKSLSSHIQCAVVGKIKLVKKDDKGKEVPSISVSDMLEIIHKKLDLTPTSGKKTEPKEHVKCEHHDVVEVKVSGWKSMVVKDYITSKIKGIMPVICNSYIMLDLKESKWDTISDKLKKGISVESDRYSKIKTLAPFIAYRILATASGTAYDSLDVIKSKVKSDDVEKALKSVL
jgi:hypothetical protein